MYTRIMSKQLCSLCKRKEYIMNAYKQSKIIKSKIHSYIMNEDIEQDARPVAMNDLKKCVKLYDTLEFFQVHELAVCHALLKTIQERHENKLSLNDLIYILQAYANDSIHNS